MNPLLTTSYMADQIMREGLDRRATRRWLAHEAAGQNHVSVAGNVKSAVARLVALLMAPAAVPAHVSPTFGPDAADCCA